MGLLNYGNLVILVIYSVVFFFTKGVIAGFAVNYNIKKGWKLSLPTPVQNKLSIIRLNKSERRIFLKKNNERPTAFANGKS